MDWYVELIVVLRVVVVGHCAVLTAWFIAATVIYVNIPVASS